MGWIIMEPEDIRRHDVWFELVCVSTIAADSGIHSDETGR
jgi:hypothetical protein